VPLGRGMHPPLGAAPFKNAEPKTALVDVDEARAAHGRTSAFAREVDRVVFEPERNAGRREIAEFKLLHKDDVVIAVLASERGRLVGTNGEFPDLKRLRSDAPVAELGESD